MNPDYGAGLRQHFLLERGIAYLNHGSFGATPRTVLAAQRGWQRRMEAEPVRFMTRELPESLAEAREPGPLSPRGARGPVFARTQPRG